MMTQPFSYKFINQASWSNLALWSCISDVKGEPQITIDIDCGRPRSESETRGSTAKHKGLSKTSWQCHKSIIPSDKVLHNFSLLFFPCAESQLCCSSVNTINVWSVHSVVHVAWRTICHGWILWQIIKHSLYTRMLARLWWQVGSSSCTRPSFTSFPICPPPPPPSHP